MRTRLLLLLWIAFWTCLSLRHVRPPATPQAPWQQHPAWPPAKLWKELLDNRPSSFVPRLGEGDLANPHVGWTPQRLRKHPYLLLHAEECHLEEISTWEQLATGRKKLSGSTRYYSHPLSDVRQGPAEIAAYEKLLTDLQPEPREALTRALNRVNPARREQLLAQLDRPDNPDWWLDAEALTRLGSRRGLEKILASPNPEVRSLAPLLDWLSAPEDTSRWRAARKLALEAGPAQQWAKARLIQFGPESLRIRAYTELIAPFYSLVREDAPGLQEWGWRRIEKGPTSPEAQQVLTGMLAQPWSPERQRRARRLVLDRRWPANMRKAVATKLLQENPANLAPKWLELWPELWSVVPVGYGEGAAYRKALTGLARRHYFEGNILERLWLAGWLTPAKARRAMKSDSGASQEEMNLDAALRQRMPSSLLAQLLDEEGDEGWTSQLWPHSIKQDARVDRAALARLGRAKFGDYLTIELLFRPESRFDPKTLAALRDQGGGPGGVASALMGKVELDGGDPNFLACHLIAHLYLKHENLPVARVYELQEGAPARLFQAAQAYLEASPDPLAALLLKKRGGRVLPIEGQAWCRWLDWLPALRREALEQQTTILAWSDQDEVRSEVRGSQLRVIRGAETRIRQLTAQELDFLQQLQKPAPARPCTGLVKHSQTLVYLAPQGGWALSLGTLPPDHPGRKWGQALWEISQNPEGTVVWSFAADFAKVETLAYYPNESFEGIGLSHGRTVLKTHQGWCDLQLRPCPGPPAPAKLGWQAVRETSGQATENTRLRRLDLRRDRFVWSYLFRGLNFENFCVQGRDLYFETRGRVVHLRLPAQAPGT